MATPSRVRALEFPSGLEWLNTQGALRLADLRGKAVILDFWTYCCINCMHVLPDLKRLESKYEKELVVIGVHSAKFPNERVTENIRQAILRYEIAHPVVNDNELKIWQAYGVRAWPTWVLIDPEGNIAGIYPGEGNYDEVDNKIGQTVSYFRTKGLIKEEPLTLLLERNRLGPSPLSFPGKVLADASKDRLFIADSNHNRIVITRLDGEVIAVAGCGQIGSKDGPFSGASFYHPQGMALSGETLYVADTENHLLRRLDLEARTVTTLAGTGKQGGFLSVGGLGTKSDLNSPWDLALVADTLYIAMAGPHQIWAMDLGTGLVYPYAGSGREGCKDGPLDSSEFAQPSGLTTNGNRLYVADSESSSIREIDIQKERVHTLVGLALFEFNDRDGQGDAVRLQHPLGVLYHEGLIYVADTYNHKIKIVNPKDRTSRTFLGTGRPGHKDSEGAQLYEPGGISFAQGRFYIADTNNHAIRIAGSDTKVATLTLKGLSSPKKVETLLLPGAEEVPLSLKTLQADSPGQLTLDLTLPEDYHLTPTAPLLYKIEVEKGLNLDEAGEIIQLEHPQLPITLPFKTAAEAVETSLKVSLTFYYCRTDNQGVCLAKSLLWRQPLKIELEGKETKLILSYRVKEKG